MTNTAVYSGDRYVDLVGLDAYTIPRKTNHISVTKLRGCPSRSASRNSGLDRWGNYDYLPAQGAADDFPRTVFFMSWNAK